MPAKRFARLRTFRRGEVSILGAVLSVTGQMEFAGFVGMGVGKASARGKEA